MASATAGQPQASSTQPNASITWTYSVTSPSGTWTAALFQASSLGGTYTRIDSTVITGSTSTGGVLTAPAYTTPTTSLYYQVQVSGGGISPTVVSTSLYFYSPFQGPQGVQGSQGLRGDQGPAGPQGAQGQQGLQGIVNIDPNTANSVLLATNNPGTITTNNNLTFTGTPGTLNITGQISANSALVHTLGAVTFTNGAVAGVTTLNTVTISSGGNVSGMGTLGCGAITSSGALALGANTIACGAITAPTSTNTINSLIINAGALTGVTTLNTITIGSSGNVSGMGTLGCGAITSSGALALGANTIACGAITSSGALALGANTIACGAITAPTTTNTINSLIINAGTCTGVDFIATSDQRIKTNITTISNALDIVKELRGVYFTRIGQTKQTVGVIAQEVETVLPEVVYTDSEGLKSVSYGNMVGVLIEAVKVLLERVEKLER
jgi:hypothetical protein